MIQQEEVKKEPLPPKSLFAGIASIAKSEPVKVEAPIVATPMGGMFSNIAKIA